MPLRVKCPSCQCTLQVPSKKAGMFIACPKCTKRMKVPEPSSLDGTNPPDKSTLSHVATERDVGHEEASIKPPPDPPTHAKPPPLPRGNDRKKDRDSKLANSVDQQSAALKSKAVDDPTIVANDDQIPAPPPRDSDRPPVEVTPPRRQRKRWASRARSDPKSRPETKEKDRKVDGEPKPAATAKPAAQPRADQRESGGAVAPPSVPAQHGGAETTAESPPLSRGFEHDSHKIWVVYQLGVAMIGLALFSVVPAALDIIEHVRSPNSAGVAPWAYALILACAIQLAYAIYLIQLPDWSSTWVVSIVTLAITTVYAMLLGIALLSKEQSQLIQMLHLDDKLRGNKVVMWSFVMLSLSSLLSYSSGRVSVRWHQMYKVLVQTSGLSAKTNDGR